MAAKAVTKVAEPKNTAKGGKLATTPAPAAAPAASSWKIVAAVENYLAPVSVKTKPKPGDKAT